MGKKIRLCDIFYGEVKKRILAGFIVLSIMLSLFGGVMSKTTVSRAADNDLPSCGTISVAYTSTSNNKSTFTISRTGGSDGEQVVYYRTVNGSAIGGTNFTHVSGSVTFAHGDTASKTVTVTEQGANIQYGSYVATKYTNADRTYSFQIYDIKGGATIGTASASRTLAKNSSYTIAQNVYTKEAKYEGYGTNPTLLSHDNKYAADRSGGEKGDAYFINDRGNNVSQDYRNFNTYARIDGFGYYGKQENKEGDFYDANVAEYLKNTSDSYLWRCYYAGDRNDDGYCHTWVGDNNAGILSMVRADTGTNRVKDGGINYNGSGQGFCSYTTDDSTFGDPIPGSDYGTNGTSNNKRYTRYLNGWNRRMYYGGTDSNSCYFKMGIHETVWFLTSASGSGEDKWHVYGFHHYIRPYDKKAPSLLAIAPMAGGIYEIGKPMTIALVFDEIVDSSKSSLSASSYITTSQGQFKYTGGADTNVLYFTGTPTTAASSITVSNINCASSIKDMMGLVSATSSQTSASVTIGNIAPTYTVKLAPGNGGAYQYITAANAAAMPDVTVPTRQAYSFDGYYDVTSGGTQYIKADGKSARAFDKNANVVLYAHWTANPPVIIYEPQPCQNLVYNMASRGLVTTGTVSNGTMYYKVDDGEWSTHIPTRSGAGTYTVSYQARGEGGESVVKSITVTIRKADISPAVSINSWTYSETVGSPTVSGNTDGGAVSFSYKKKGESDSSYTGVKPSDVGEYTVRATIAATANYNGGTATNDFTIAKKTVTVPSGIKAKDKDYDGTVSAEFDTSKAVFSGKKDGDNLTISATGEFDNKNAGEEKTVTISGLTLGGASAGNYQLDKAGNQISTTAAINKRSVILTSATADKPYDGTPLTNDNVTVSGAGFIDGEGAAYSVTGSQEEVGSSKNTFTYTLNTGTEADNYDISKNEGTLTVTQTANEWIQNPSIEDWTYGDTPGTQRKGEPKYGEATDIEITYRGRGGTDYAESTEVPTAAGDYTAVFTLDGTDDYQTLKGTADFTIKKRQVTVSGITAKDKTYDGGTSATPVCDDAVFDGIMPDDIGKLGVRASGTYSDQNVGMGKTVSLSDLTLTGEAVGNYELAATGHQKETTANITKRHVILTSASDEKVYDGSALINDTVTVGGDGFVIGEGASYTVTGSQINKGTGENEFTYALNSGTNEDNYDIEVYYGELVITSMTISGGKIDFDDFKYGTSPLNLPALKKDGTVLDDTVNVRYYIKKTAFLKSEIEFPETVASVGKVYDDVDFSSLSAGTYYICAVVERTDDYSQFITQKAFKVTPSNDIRSATQTPEVRVDDKLSVTIAEEDRYKKLEYSLDDGTPWSDVPLLSEGGDFTLSGLSAGTHTIIIREKKDKNYNQPSAPCAPVEFILNGFSVMYYSNGGVNAPQSQYATSPEKIVIADDSGMRRTGYRFAGWNTASDGGGTSYEPETEVDDGLILYAIWEPIDYTVVFKAEDCEGSMESQGFSYGESKKLSDNDFTHKDPENWTFLGWAKTPDGDVVYSDGQSVSNLTATNGETVTLHAVWYQSKYSIEVNVTSDKSDKITVEIRRGNMVLRTHDADVSMSETESEEGKYSAKFVFKGIPMGIYNAVAIQETNGVKRVMTSLVELTEDKSLDIEMPEGETNSILELSGDKTPSVMAGGLDDEAEALEVAGHEVTVTMTVEALDDSENVETSSNVADILQKAKTDVSADIVMDDIQFFDISMEKTVMPVINEDTEDTSEVESRESILETRNLMEILIPYDFTKKSKVMVYRAHTDDSGNLSVEAFKESDKRLLREGSLDGYFYADKSNGYVFIYAKKFSTYAIAYEEEKSPSVGGDAGGTGSGVSGGSGNRNTSGSASGVSGGSGDSDTSGSASGVSGGSGDSDTSGSASDKSGGSGDSDISGSANDKSDGSGDSDTSGSASDKSGGSGDSSSSEDASGEAVESDTDTDVSKDSKDDGKSKSDKTSDKVSKKDKKKTKIELNSGLILKTKGKKAIVKWGKVKKADRYVVYASYCGKDCKKIATLDKTKTKYTFKKLGKKSLDTKKNLKCYVVAYRKVGGKYVRLSKSLTGHAAGSGSKKYTNVKKIKPSAKSVKLSINKGYKIKAKLIPNNKKKKLFIHAAKYRYASSDTSIAKVNKKGRIIAKKRGTCYVYVYAQNGFAARIRVSVKDN